MSTDSIRQIPSEIETNSNNHRSFFEKLQRGELLKSVTIPAKMINRLIKDSHRIIKAPIRIEDSTIEGDLNLQYTTFKSGLSITNSIFKGTVDLSCNTFEQLVDFSGSHFEERADFRAAHAVYDFKIDLATFPDNTSFEDLHVDEIFRAQGAQFGSTNFERIRVAKSILFCPSHCGRHKRTRFRGDVNFSDANIQGPAHFEGAYFEKRAIFDRVCFNSMAIFKCYQHNDQVHSTISAIDNAACPPLNHKASDFLRTRFRGQVSFVGAEIHGDTSFSGACFKDKATFEHVKIDGSLDFQPLSIGDCSSIIRVIRVHFGGETSFRGTHVKGNASFHGAHFMKIAKFEQFNTGGSLLFLPAQTQKKLFPVCFEDEATFQNAHIREDAAFYGAHFKKKAVFNRFETAGSAYFSTYTLTSKQQEKDIIVKFKEADRKKLLSTQRNFTEACRIIHQKLQTRASSSGLDQTQTREERLKALYRRKKPILTQHWLTAELSEIFSPVKFDEDARFLDARIGGMAVFDGAQFKGAALFERMTVGGSIFFRAVDYNNFDDKDRVKYPVRICPLNFGGGASFVGAHIRAAAEFDGAQFGGGAETVAAFERIEIYGNTYFRPYYADTDPVTFQCKVNFLGAYIKGDAEFSGAQFKDDAEFKGMHIDGDAYFDAKHHLDNNALLTGNEINCVSFSGLADFSGIHFKNEAYFDHALFNDKTKFMGAEINGIASFAEAIFYQETIFDEARFSLLSFVGERKKVIQQKNPFRFFVKKRQREPPSQFKGKVEMHGTKYEIIKVNLNELTEALKQSEQYDLQPYAHLEKVLLSIGNDHEADYVYLQRRHRGREKLRKRCGQSINYLIRFVLDWFYWKIGNYGVHPYKLIFYSLLIISLGTAVFTRPGAVEPKEEELVTIQRQFKSLAQGQAENLTDEHLKAAIREDLMNPVYNQESLNLTQAFGVSLSQFIPIVEIPSGNRWKPSEKRILCWRGYCISYAFYGSIHRLLGALFVPLGVAALAVMLYRHAKLLREGSE